MITSITIEDEFETSNQWHLGSEVMGGGRTMGYKLPALPIGTKLDTDSQIVILIGPNGSGKTTLLEKLAAQTSERGKECKARYFNLQYKEHEPRFYFVGRAGQDKQNQLVNEAEAEIERKAGKIFEEEKKIAGVKLIPSCEGAMLFDDIRRTALKEDTDRQRYIENASTGQFQELYALREIEKAKKMPEGTILCLDEPTLGLDMLNTRKIIRAVREYTLETGRQVFIATHEPAFCKIPKAKIISLYDKIATCRNTEKFNIEEYLEEFA